MKVLHLPFTYYPNPVGGTETYVAALIEQMRRQGADGIVAAPGAEPATYSVQGTVVHRLAVAGERLTLRELYSEGDARVAEQFARVMDQERPDLVHMHAFTSAVSLQLVRIAKGRDLPSSATPNRKFRLFSLATSNCRSSGKARKGPTSSS